MAHQVFPSRGMRIHCVGIKGAGVSALACILLARGAHVCGSDVREDFFTDAALERIGISYEKFGTHALEKDVDMVIYSTAWSDHSEVEKAKACGIPILPYHEALAYVFNSAQCGIAVCGTHGKTTITAMAAFLFARLGLDPTAIIGSFVKQLDTNALTGSSAYCIIEADEYENKLQHYRPACAIITSIEHDHPDWFSSESEYQAAFIEFASRHVAQYVIAGWDDKGVRAALAGVPSTKIITYGWDSGCAYAGRDYRIENNRPTCTVLKHGNTAGILSVPLVGRHNLTNALAVIALSDIFALAPLERILDILGTFEGCARRFEYKGTCGTMMVFDDYGHHPTEVRTTLHAARHHFPEKRIWCVFGPHTYSRTKAFLAQFAQAFHHVRTCCILDIYGSAREQSGSIHAKDLVDAVNEVSGNAHYTPHIDDAVRMIIKNQNEIDILITIGAGDVWRVGEKLLHEIAPLSCTE